MEAVAYWRDCYAGRTLRDPNVILNPSQQSLAAAGQQVLALEPGDTDRLILAAGGAGQFNPAWRPAQGRRVHSRDFGAVVAANDDGSDRLNTAAHVGSKIYGENVEMTSIGHVCMGWGSRGL